MHTIAAIQHKLDQVEASRVSQEARRREEEERAELRRREKVKEESIRL